MNFCFFSLGVSSFDFCLGAERFFEGVTRATSGISTDVAETATGIIEAVVSGGAFGSVDVDSAGSDGAGGGRGLGFALDLRGTFSITRVGGGLGSRIGLGKVAFSR